MAILYLAALIALAATLSGFTVDTMIGMGRKPPWATAHDSWAALIDGPVGRRESTVATGKPDGGTTTDFRCDQRLESELEAA